MSTDEVCGLSCNVDDMTAEEMGFAMEQLLHGGALEVYTTPIGMKKCRPGTMLTVLCREADREEMVRLLFLHTTTIGVRESCYRRYVLDREADTRSTPWGPVRRKTSRGYGVCRWKYEFDDLSRLAKEQGVSLREAARMVEEAGSDSEN